MTSFRRIVVRPRCDVCASSYIFVKVTDIMDYEAALSFSVENSSAQHDVVAGATGGPVAPRLDRIIRRETMGCETRGMSF